MLLFNSLVKFIQFRGGYKLSEPKMSLIYNMFLCHYHKRLFHPDFFLPQFENLIFSFPVVEQTCVIVQKPPLLEDVYLIEPSLDYLSDFKHFNFFETFKLEISVVSLGKHVFLELMKDLQCFKFQNMRSASLDYQSLPFSSLNKLHQMANHLFLEHDTSVVSTSLNLICQLHPFIKDG